MEGMIGEYKAFDFGEETRSGFELTEFTFDRPDDHPPATDVHYYTYTLKNIFEEGSAPSDDGGLF